MFPIRDAITAQVRRLVGTTDPSLEAARTDTGLFGPDSASWQVHGDFTSMMVGGTAALLLQMLHPGALAGVWDHSDFRSNMHARLRGTAMFIASVTYGSRSEAEAQIARVRAIHDKVVGLLPDGTPYAANDPELLRWVHVAEVTSFLAGYLRYRDPAFPAARQDRYLDEAAQVGLHLGAQDLPRDRAAAAAYLRDIRPDLRHDERTREVARALLETPPPTPAAAPAFRLMFDAAFDLLPDWALEMHGVRLTPARRASARLGMKALGGILRWGLRDTAEARARRRAAALAQATAVAAGR